MRKIVINRDFGGFSIPDKWCGILGTEDNYHYEDRENPKLVELVEQGYASLKTDEEREDYPYGIVEFPDEATDWLITEYDGAETAYYVIDGKICTPFWTTSIIQSDIEECADEEEEE